MLCKLYVYSDSSIALNKTKHNLVFNIIKKQMCIFPFYAFFHEACELHFSLVWNI